MNWQSSGIIVAMFGAYFIVKSISDMLILKKRGPKNSKFGLKSAESVNG